MRTIIVLTIFACLHAKGQIIQECDFNRINVRFEISNIIADDFHHKYSFDYTFRVQNNDSVPRYIAVEDSLHDSTILSNFSGRYGLNRVMKFYFGTCNESRLPETCQLPDQSLVLRKVGYGEVLFTKRTVNTVREVSEALRKSQLDVVLIYFNSGLSNETSRNGRVTKKLYWDSQNDMKKLCLKINMQNFKELGRNAIRQ
ncbi:MAG: hypothetical protein P4L51_00995 [Puia sp.]|nr:hypothetical protein [Puia sp.]